MVYWCTILGIDNDNTYLVHDVFGHIKAIFEDLIPGWIVQPLLGGRLEGAATYENKADLTPAANQSEADLNPATNDIETNLTQATDLKEADLTPAT